LSLTAVLKHNALVKSFSWDPSPTARGSSCRLAVTTADPVLLLWSPSGNLASSSPLSLAQAHWRCDGQSLLLQEQDRACLCNLAMAPAASAFAGGSSFSAHQAMCEDFDSHLHKTALALQAFKQYMMKSEGKSREDPVEQPRKHWEDAFATAEEVVIKKLVNKYPLAAWSEPTMDTLEHFMAAVGENEISKAKVLRELDKTKKNVDRQLFLVACVVNLMRAGCAQKESDVKPNNGNRLDKVVKQLIAEGVAGKPDELPPDSSQEKLASLQRIAKDHLKNTLFENI